jgi:hypothetical protein
MLCALWITPNITHAEMYKIISEDGSIIFTDTKPSIDAKEHHPGRISAVENPQFNKKRIEDAAKDAEKKAEDSSGDQ